MHWERGMVAVALAVIGTRLPAVDAAEGPAMNADVSGAARSVCIGDVDRYRVREPLFECVRVVLAKRGETYTPEYLQGISGAAFRIAGICPCAPTCSAAMPTEKLVETLGYQVRRVGLDDSGEDARKQIQRLAEACKANGGALPTEDRLDTPQLKVLQRQTAALTEAVKAEIRAGRPAIVWHAFTAAEYDVVAGFDDDRGIFLGRGSYAGGGADLASASQARTLEAVYVGGPPTAILIGAKQGPFDAPKAEIAALQEAVRHAYSTRNRDQVGQKPWMFLEGLAAYDQWLRHFGDPTAKRGSGDAYCYGIYRSTHRAAAGFLREIAPKHPQGQAHLTEAATHFQAEADVLKDAESLLSWKSPEGPDAARNARVVETLTKARAEYAAGIAGIRKALGALGAPVEVAVPAGE